MAELRQRQAEDQGLTTSDLANLNEPASGVREINQDREVDRVGSVSGEGFRASASSVESIDDRRTAGKTKAGEVSSQGETEPLFPPDELKSFHSRWDAIQVGFVDEPRQAVQQADSLVASAMKRLAEVFAEERGHLDQQWDRGGDVSTEDLRIALRRYRSFFGRLLSV
jgi:hypothetical protein